MAQRVVLHAGLMKSGTSYLQERLFLNRDLLAARGVLVPGRGRRDQTLAVQDVLGRQASTPKVRGSWAQLLNEVQDHQGDAVISMEFLGPIAPARIGGIVESLGAPVDVVLTVRDLGRVVPAMWQERLKNGGTLGWREYVDSLGRGEDGTRGFWWQQGAARIVRNWAEAVGHDQVTVVTVPLPGADPGLLWSRFCAAAAIAGDGCEEVSAANASLDVASAVVLRKVNQALADGGGIDAEHQLLLKFQLAKKVMGSRAGGRPIGFQPPPWLEERADTIVAKIRGSGVRVVGDLAELAPLAVPGDDPEHLAPEEALAAAVDALCGITDDYFAHRIGARPPAAEPDA